MSLNAPSVAKTMASQMRLPLPASFTTTVMPTGTGPAESSHVEPPHPRMARELPWTAESTARRRSALVAGSLIAITSIHAPSSPGRPPIASVIRLGHFRPNWGAPPRASVAPTCARHACQRRYARAQRSLCPSREQFAPVLAPGNVASSPCSPRRVAGSYDYGYLAEMCCVGADDVALLALRERRDVAVGELRRVDAHIVEHADHPGADAQRARRPA